MNEEINETIEITPVFKTLFAKNINFAIGISNMRMRFVSDNNVKDYFIIVSHTSLKKLKGFGFLKTKNSDKLDANIIEYSMNKKDVNYFQSIRKRDFNIVVKNKYGRIYELKNKPFKKYIDRQVRREKENEINS